MNLLDPAAGERLGDTFLTRYYEDFWDCGPGGCWKLKRAQHFIEPDSSSWIAFSRGDWEQALWRTEARRTQLTDYYRKIDQHSFYTCQVRVVEYPVTPYLQWESHLLRLRNELGGFVRTVTAAQVTGHEAAGQLPEVVTLGTGVMYQLVYSGLGLLQGGIRYTDPELVRGWRELIAGLFDQGEDMQVWFDREVAPLPAPGTRD